ncbi:hypothetical protein [Mycolicibacterium baixiangningiae]|uniref:hypothetical protein n=1 Tax=Mycolicibacterium baixiangningiae TaxID=2761578 RepID=UPI0018693063|nr:hypothetical protein [Mycolicibacterium baixiangningiae]
MIALASSTNPSASGCFSRGWVFLAAAVFISLVVAEYQGPIIGIAVSVTAIGVAILCSAGLPVPKFPGAAVWLVGILILGLGSAVLADVRGQTSLDVDVQRDLGISLSYLLYLSVGCYFSYSRHTLRLLLIAVVAAGLLISVVHLVRLSEVLSSGATDLYLFRLEAGRGSVTQFAALCSTLVLLRDSAKTTHRTLIIGSATVLVMSMLMTLSRGLMFLLIILVVGATGLTVGQRNRLSVNVPRLLITVAAAMAAAASIYVLTRICLPVAHLFIDEYFITRLANSVTEVSGTKLETRTQIADSYRAFELNRAMVQFEAQPAYAQWIGQGWGSHVNFGFETASTRSTFSRTGAAFLHNGYAYFLMKTGIVGLVLYLGFMLHALARAASRNTWPTTPSALTRRKLLLVVATGLAVGTVTTGGLGFPATYLGLVLILGACYGPAWNAEANPEISKPQPEAVMTLRRKRFESV